MEAKKILVINQFSGFLCRDLVNAFQNDFGSTVLMSGNAETQTIHPRVDIWKGIPYNRKSILTRFFTWIVFTFQALFSSRSKSSDIWVLVSNPPFIPIFMGFKAIRKKKPYFLIIYDLYPEALKQIQFISEKSFFFKLWQKWNRTVFSKASGIITLSGSMKKAIETYLPNSEYDKVLVVPNWFDASTQKTDEELKGTERYQDQWMGKRVVLYSGNFGMTHDLETLVEIANHLKEEKNIQFVMAGEGAKKEKLVQMAQNYSLPNLEFLPFQSLPDFSSLLKRADIAVVSLGPGAESISVPSKTYNSMGAGLCILGISPGDSALNEIIEDFKVGYNILPGKVQDGVDFLKSILTDTRILDQFKSASLKASTQFTHKNTELYRDFILKQIS